MQSTSTAPSAGPRLLPSGRTARTWFEPYPTTLFDPAVPYLQHHNEPVYVIDANPNAENIAKLIYDFTARRDSPSSK